MYYEALQNVSFHVKITADIGQTTQEYTCNYVYQKDNRDTLTLETPDILKDITIWIAGAQKPEFVLQYEDTELEVPGLTQAGLTPADAIAYLLYELRASSPTQVWQESAQGVELTVVQYTEPETEVGEVIRQIWLNTENNQMVAAEVYVQGERVLQCLFDSWSEAT